MGEADELFKIKLLIERANIKYANLLEEFQSKGLETMTVSECMDFMRRTEDKEILDRIFNILLMRGYIQVINGRISPTNLNFVNKGKLLDANDKNFAIQLLNKYGTYDAI